jgi:hypothetical protein
MNYIEFLDEFLGDGIVDVKVVAFDIGGEPFWSRS